MDMKKILMGTVALIALASTALTVPVAALAAFIFARFAFRGREVLYTIFTLGLLFPVAIAILPIFIMVRNLGCSTTRWASRCRRRPSAFR